MEVANNFFQKRLKTFGVPAVETGHIHFISNNPLWKKITDFVYGDIDYLALVGDNSYVYAIKLLKLCLAKNIQLTAKFRNLSSVVNNFDRNVYDVFCLTEVHTINQEFFKEKSCQALQDITDSSNKVVLQANSPEDIAGTFQPIWDFVDNTFQVIRF